MFLPIFEQLNVSKHEVDALNPLAIFAALQGDSKDDAFYFRRSAHSEVPSEAPTDTILAIEPFETITVGGVEGNEDGDPFKILARRMQQYRRPVDPELPFFQGGALGYFAYDSVRYIEPKVQIVSTGPVAEFRLFKRAVIFDHIRSRVFLMSGYFEGTDSQEIGIARAREEIAELRRICSRNQAGTATGAETGTETGAQTRPGTQYDQMLGRNTFLRGVRKLKENIRNGDIFQAVLSEKFRAPFKGDPLALFSTLCDLSPAPYQFYFSTSDRVVLGASPELLMRLQGDELETHPIAGTRPRSADPVEERKLERQLLRSEKEKAEHLMLVDLARNDLGRVAAPGTVRVDNFMQIRKFAAVMHLVSRVTGKLSPGMSGIEALASFFPAGTLSGAPKVRAMQLINKLEPEPRGFYGGAVVAASFTGDVESCIAIRSIQLENGIATVQAGAGIVADSKPEMEYSEVLHKSRIARKALGISNGQYDSDR